MVKSSFTFVQLPEDEAAFLDFVRTTGDIWCRSVGDHPHEPQYDPLPVAEFLGRYAHVCRRHGSLGLYFGFEPAIIRPPTWSRVQTVQGKRTRESHVDEPAAQFVRFNSGGLSDEARLAPPPGGRCLVISTIGYYSGSFQGNQWLTKPPEFLRWAKKLLAWWRRRATQTVPVDGRNDHVPATLAAYEAVQQGGLKVV